MRPEPGSAPDWLRHTRSDLALSRVSTSDEVLPETRCFHAQQAAEKSIKAVLVAHGAAVPRTHNLGTLLARLPATIVPPPDVSACAGLTDYAVMVRYPGEHEEIAEDELHQAVECAAAVVARAEQILALPRR